MYETWRTVHVKFLFIVKLVKLLYTCVVVVYMSVLDVLCMYMEFAFGWCAGGCESVGAILMIGGISMVCVPLCVVLVVVLRIFMVVGCLYDVGKILISMRACSMHLRWMCL